MIHPWLFHTLSHSIRGCKVQTSLNLNYQKIYFTSDSSLDGPFEMMWGLGGPPEERRGKVEEEERKGEESGGEERKEER